MEDKLAGLLNKIKPSFFELFLEKSGWVQVEYKKKLAYAMYQIKKNDEMYQVNVPLDESLYDYHFLLSDACKKLSVFYEIEIEEVVSRIINPQADIIKIRVGGDSVNDGSIPMDEALSLFDRSKKMIADAANDVVSKTKYRKAIFMLCLNY
ncbi:MAG: hypothetical protein J5666_04585 [Bacilli bacterium]|nr:hypothetical protein [Bacilli bacterium]